MRAIGLLRGIAAVAVLVSGSFEAEAVVKTIVCDPPRGTRGQFEFGFDEAMRWMEDGYTGTVATGGGQKPGETS
jgi:hypothetical protein